MNEIDEKIKAALKEEDMQLYEDINTEAGLFELVGLSFKGKNAWMTWYMWILGFVVFFLGVYSFTEFLAQEDIKSSLAWMIAIIACLLILTLIKIMSWQQMHKLEVMRELKRLELRILTADR